ncbi:MAG: AAA family ATPase [Chloroflexota bacterium]
MPGTRLSQAEKNLIKDWNRRNHKHDMLESLTISGVGGIRGIRSLTLNCDRPITAICGASGVGKSTLLELCALAFRAKGAPSPDDVATAFDEQFVTVANEAPFNNFAVTWHYVGDHQSVVFDGANRTTSTERPERPVIFISMSRMAPIRHQPAQVAQIRNHPPGTETPLEKGLLKQLQDILGKPYQSAHWQDLTDTRLTMCEANQRYSGFNMSSAEENLIEVFRQIHLAPTSALLIIEDIDTGLHPTTCKYLAENLVSICKDRSFQIILSTRSPEFIDALPRAFRTLIEFDGTDHYVDDAVSMRETLPKITTSTPTDLLVFCEDEVAEAIIRQIVDGDTRRRMKVVKAGAQSALAQFAYSNYRADWGYKILIVWDGDVKDADVIKWIRSLGMTNEEQLALSRLQLPGPEPPERWLITQLLKHDGADLLARELGEDVREVRMMLNALVTTAEHHAIFYELAKRAQLDQARVLDGVVRATSNLPHRPLTQLTEQIQRVAAGESQIAIGQLDREAT